MRDARHAPQATDRPDAVESIFRLDDANLDFRDTLSDTPIAGAIETD
jgi:hypothetical protein